ncbi:MAG TPA: hypothetical protein VI356_05770 [Myxococcales bacterium]
MPVSRKRRKEGKSRPRDRVEAASAPRADPPASSGGGMLTRMRSGFQKMAGTAPKKESLLSKIVTWAIVAIAAYFVARRFGIVP